MLVYEYTSYKKYLRQACEARKGADRAFSYARLAAAVRVQRSYLSHVLNGEAHLSADQLYEAGRFLRLPDDDVDYLLLLLEIERCGIDTRRRRLLERRDALQAAKLRSEAYLGRHPVAPAASELAEYFSDPFCPIVHMYLTIPSYLADPAKIAARLGLGQERLTSVLGVLERCRFVEIAEGGRYKVNQQVMHLPESSYLSKVHGAAMRLHGLTVRQQAGAPSDYFFTASFSATEAVKLEIRTAFLAFLKDVTKRVDPAPAEHVYHMNFDLFQI